MKNYGLRKVCRSKKAKYTSLESTCYAKHILQGHLPLLRLGYLLNFAKATEKRPKRNSKRLFICSLKHSTNIIPEKLTMQMEQ